MKPRLIVATVLAVAASPATAQDAQTYLYDGNGRLVAATTARTGADGVVSRYALDDADNRADRSAVAVTTPAADKLAYPASLVPTQKITSANGLYTMTLEPGGDLVIATSTTTLWRSCTGEGRSTFARVGSDGRLAIHDPALAAFWTTPNAASPGAELTLQNNGVAVLKSTGGATLWSSTTQCQ